MASKTQTVSRNPLLTINGQLACTKCLPTKNLELCKALLSHCCSHGPSAINLVQLNNRSARFTRENECRKYASNDQQTSTQLHVTEDNQDNVGEKTVVVVGEEYSLESFNVLEGNETQIHDESIINDINVTSQGVPA